MKYYVEVLKKYAVFNGRARRREYWMFSLYNFLIGFGIGLVGGFLDMTILVGALTILYTLFILIPSLAVSIRRLHDTGRSGWWLLIALIPLIGAIVLLIFYVSDSAPGSNKYGPNQKEAPAA